MNSSQIVAAQRCRRLLNNYSICRLHAPPVFLPQPRFKFGKDCHRRNGICRERSLWRLVVLIATTAGQG